MPTYDTLVKGVRSYSIVATRETIIDEPVRYMSIQEIKEREQLNIANTASSLRKRVVSETLSMAAAMNGHSSINGDKPIT